MDLATVRIALNHKVKIIRNYVHADGSVRRVMAVASLENFGLEACAEIGEYIVCHAEDDFQKGGMDNVKGVYDSRCLICGGDKCSVYNEAHDST
jgi:hypothetical protein